MLYGFVLFPLTITGPFGGSRQAGRFYAACVYLVYRIDGCCCGNNVWHHDRQAAIRFCCGPRPQADILDPEILMIIISGGLNFPADPADNDTDNCCPTSVYRQDSVGDRAVSSLLLTRSNLMSFAQRLASWAQLQQRITAIAPPSPFTILRNGGMVSVWSIWTERSVSPSFARGCPGMREILSGDY